MNVISLAGSVAKLKGDALIVGISGEEPLAGAAKEANEAAGGIIEKLRKQGDVKGKLGEITAILAPTGLTAARLILLGLGETQGQNRGAAFRAAATAAKHAASQAYNQVVYALGADWPDEVLESAVAGAIVGCVGQDLHRKQRNFVAPEAIVWHLGKEDVLQRGVILGESINTTRHLVNEGPSTMNPVGFAAAAERLAKEAGLEIEIWDEQKLKQENCGSLLAVARGSSAPPRLVIFRHNGGGSGDPLLAIVGKGVTFDSGGLSLKPTDGMKTMKCDMAGAATVAGTLRAIAALKLPVNVVGLCGLVENMVSGDSYKLGDILTARSGKTIEVLNTDAEGRLVLADVLNVAVEMQPAHIVDLATLTGACVVALGTDVAGLMTNDSAWCSAIEAAAETCGEQVWELPMFEEFGDQIKSEVADIKNVGEGRWGGAITAGKFLEEFVEGVSWTHIDIAGPAFSEKPRPWIDAGGSGALVRTLVEVARNWPAR